MKKNKAFTLIELIAVLVILAILALIVTPLVMNIIRKARTAADKRSVDAYGRSIELAIASYLLDNGKFPTSVEQLTIEYSGDEVVCGTTQLNGDSSVYLTGCTVGGRNVDYSYGTDKTPPAPTYVAYSVGDEVTYNNVDYYVIANSGINESTVTLLKAEPLTVAEVNQYGAGHINRYTWEHEGTAYNYNGYGGMAYYSSETCGVDSGEDIYDTGCMTDYVQSEIKYVVDAWKIDKASAAIDARLITKQEIDDNFEFEEYDCCGGCGGCIGRRVVDSWMYNSNYAYWTMSQDENLTKYVWYVNSNGAFGSSNVYSYTHVFNVVRPVITLAKSEI